MAKQFYPVILALAAILNTSGAAVPPASPIFAPRQDVKVVERMDKFRYPCHLQIEAERAQTFMGAEKVVTADVVTEVVEVTEVDQQGETFPYTEADIVALAQMLYGEARGCSYDDQRNCCITVCNRAESGSWYGTTVYENVTAPSQYYGYSPYNPVWDNLYAVAAQVLLDWQTHTNWNSYTSFSGDGVRNYFR